MQFRQQAGATVVLVKDDGHVIGALAVRGELHPEAAEVIARLRFGRLPHHHAHQRQPRYHHRCGGRRRHRRRARRTPPENKARIISELGTRQSTAMLGDGANDVPALATADLGSTMAATGTDAAIETTNVALLGDDLRHSAPAAMPAASCRNTSALPRLLTSLMPLALFGFLGLTAVVLVHEVVGIVVIVNGVRAGRTEPLSALPGGKFATARPAFAGISP